MKNSDSRLRRVGGVRQRRRLSRGQAVMVKSLIAGLLFLVAPPARAVVPHELAQPAGAGFWEALRPDVQLAELERLESPSVLRINYVTLDISLLWALGQKEVAWVNIQAFPDVAITMELRLENPPIGGTTGWISPRQTYPFLRVSAVRSPIAESVSKLSKADYNSSIHFLAKPQGGLTYSSRPVRGAANIWAIEEGILAELTEPPLGPSNTPPLDLGDWMPDETEDASSFETVYVTGFYTEGALFALGTVGTIEFFWADWIQFMNLIVLPNSNVNGEVQLAGVEPVPEFAGGSLMELGQSQELFLLRRGWGGDLGVILSTASELSLPGDSEGGAANAHTVSNFSANPNLALFAITTGGSQPTQTAAHEFGHLNGGCHQKTFEFEVCSIGFNGTSFAFHDESAGNMYMTLVGTPAATGQGSCGGAGVCDRVDAYSENGGFLDGRPIGDPERSNVQAVRASMSLLEGIMGNPEFRTIEVIKTGDGADGGWIDSLDRDEVPDLEIRCGDQCQAEYRLGYWVHLRVDQDISASQGAEFTQWSGECTFFVPAGGDLEDPEIRFFLDRAGVEIIDCSAEFDAIEATGEGNLSVVKVGEAEGTVTSDPAGIDCGPTCSSTFDVANPITLTAADANGNAPSAWGGACDHIEGASGSVTVIAGETQECLVSFDQDGANTLVVDVQNPGRVIGNGIDCPGDCDESFAAPAEVTLDAQDVSGPFVQWEGDCVQDPDVLRRATVMVDGFVSCTAVFGVEETRVLSLLKAGTGQGTVQTSEATPRIFCGPGCSGGGAATYGTNEQPTIRAIEQTGFRFEKWEGDGCNTTSPLVNFFMSIDRTCTATFAPIESRVVKVTVNVLNSDPTIFEGTPHVFVQPGGFECTSNCSEQFALGSTVTLTAVDDGDIFFDGWQLDCAGLNGSTIELLVTEAGPEDDPSLACQAKFQCEGFPLCGIEFP